jgi:hypothetical protein
MIAVRTDPIYQTATASNNLRHSHKRPQTFIGVVFGGGGANPRNIATRCAKSRQLPVRIQAPAKKLSLSGHHA